MDNEAPKYADWVPEAGGYVVNGNVVSKSPLYDEGGKLRMYVDASLFGNTRPVSQNAQVANTLQGNTGVQTANIAGSGTDANAMATSIGSNGSLNLNTANTDNSAVSSPATKSNVTGDIVLNPVDKANQDYQDAVGRNDYQGMINALTQLGTLTGQDYSTQIDGLRKQREQKIMGVDDNFIAQYQNAQEVYNQAIRSGDEELARQAVAAMNQIDAQQSAWRDQVGYQDAVTDAYNRAEQDLIIDYQTSFLDGAKDIANTITQLTNSYFNFQYDPTTDQDLLRAQAQVELRMRNNMAATGMYYSSTTQYAIAQAIGELVPIYEKMAKEEIKENITMLQNTANFLVDLEQTQFNMWKSKIQLQLDMNEEKRKQFQQALDASNARGYVNNEEAAILGVEPGSMSKEARDHARDLQEEIDKEYRALEQSMILADYKKNIDMQMLEREYELRDWADARSSARQMERDYQNNLWDYYTAALKSSGSNESAPTYEVEYTDENGKTIKYKLTATKDAMGNWVDNQGNIIQPASGSVGTSGGSWNQMAAKYGLNAATVMQEVYDLKNVSGKDFSDKSVVSDFSKALSKDVNANNTEKIEAFKKALNPNAKEVVGPVKQVTANVVPYLEGIYLNKAMETVAEASKNFGDDWGVTANGISAADNAISNMLGDLKSNNADNDTIYNAAKLMYAELIEAIANAGDNFAYDPSNGTSDSKNGVVTISGPGDGLDQALSSGIGTLFGAGKGDKSKEDAMIAIIKGVNANKNIPADIKGQLCKDLSEQAYEFASREGSKGYTGLSKRNSWQYLTGNKK